MDAPVLCDALMEIGGFADDVGSLTSTTRLPASARRLSQKVLLVVMSGTVRVADADRAEHIRGPAWVTWYPGDRLEYEPVGEAVYWLFAARVRVWPPGLPRPGSLISVRKPTMTGGFATGETHVAAVLLVDYWEVDNAGIPTGFVVSDPNSGIGHYQIDGLLSVLEHADRDLWDWDYGPGLDKPQLRVEPSR